MEAVFEPDLLIWTTWILIGVLATLELRYGSVVLKERAEPHMGASAKHLMAAIFELIEKG